MTDYWQDKRINHRHVTCAWALVVVVVALMLAITSLEGPVCPLSPDDAASACEAGDVAHTATAERRLP